MEHVRRQTMELIEKKEKDKKEIKLGDDELLDLVMLDKQEAEKYFSKNVEPGVVMRYQLLNGSEEYYSQRFPKLHNLCKFKSSDIKDVVEWLMPSFTEVFFGADKIVGIFGRTRDDDPDVLEKVIEYQIKTQNKGYVILDQWIRDALESGLGVIRLEWEHREVKTDNDYHATAEEYLYMPPEMAKKKVKNVEPLPDGTYILTMKDIEVVKDQPVLRNVMPGEYIYLPDESEDGQMVFECHRRKMLYNDLMRLGKLGIYKNLEDFEFIANTSDDSSMDRIADAIRNYVGESKSIRNDVGFDASNRENQDARKTVLLYDCWGQYDVDGDGLLEYVHVVTANNRILFKEINEVERSPFFHLSFYQNSYQEWKASVADFLQDDQDLKTALLKQIIINTTINNDRSFIIDGSQIDARKDLESGKKIIRLNLGMGKNASDVIVPAPQYELPKEAFTLLELASTWSEQKTGITKYNQGLDAGSLNKTATGISQIMNASKQRMRKMARDGAENGIVPLYKHLIKLDKMYLKSDFTFRLTNNYYDFAPDDINGDYDVQITSNIGLQDKQLTIQNLMLMFTQILPNLMQMNAASPQGMYETANQIIQEMGFTNPDKYLGLEASSVSASNTANQIVQMLPNIMMQLGQQLGLSPEQAGAIAQQLAQVIQQNIQQQQPMPTQAEIAASMQTPGQNHAADAIKQIPTTEQNARQQGIFR